MLMAQLRGKLPTEVWLGSEDLLTSAVFGTLKNLSPSVIAALLSRVQPLRVPLNTCHASADLANRLRRMYTRSPKR